MGFLDNSGDIILDAVLTDTGRMRMAKGDGSFKIVKFALSDDEIDYSTFNNAHASGSAYYDLEILQTPVFEAFTNNTSLMKSKLVSYTRTDLLYLPVMEWYYTGNNKPAGEFPDQLARIAVDKDTTDALGMQGGVLANLAYNVGYMAFDKRNNPITIEQGLNTTEFFWDENLQSDLVETQYIVEIDDRLGRIIGGLGENPDASPSFIDDDFIASYFFSFGIDTDFIEDKAAYGPRARMKATGNNAAVTPPGPIKGPFGTALTFMIMPSFNLQSSDFYFTKLGRTTTEQALETQTSPVAVSAGDNVAVKVIDSTVRITGATTGFTISVPIRFVKK